MQWQKNAVNVSSPVAMQTGRGGGCTILSVPKTVHFKAFSELVWAQMGQMAQNSLNSKWARNNFGKKSFWTAFKPQMTP